jgi:hypothetical protein
MGGPAANLTAVMSGQVDVGWAAPPFGLDQLDKGDIRRIATGNDAAVFKGQTVRLNIANANFLAAKKDVVARYMKAYRETVRMMYTDEGLKVYADWLQLGDAKARRTRDEFFPSPAIEPDTIVGLDTIVKDAVELKFTATQLTREQLCGADPDSAAITQDRLYPLIPERNYFFAPRTPSASCPHQIGDRRDGTRRRLAVGQAVLHGIDQHRADHHAVRAFGDRARAMAGLDAEPHRDRQCGVALDACDRSLHLRRVRSRRAGDTGDGDVIDEA